MLVGVELRDFRSYARAQARLAEGLTVVHGANAAGKSNLLEALYYACTGHSPRTRNERELVRFGAQAARVAVAVRDGEDTHELSVGYEPAAGGARAEKRMACDGAPLERMLEAPFRPLVSVFVPDRLELIKGAPALRRGHLDQFVCALWPARAQARTRYARALAQRNALLARLRLGGGSRATLAAWDHELARWGLELRAHRAQAVELLCGPFATRARELGCAGEIVLEYRPRTSAADEQEFLSELASRHEGEIARGLSGHGPHRDDLAIVRAGRELRTYGSQGETRLALLALLLAERSVLGRERQAPLLLLDDVMSELDGERRALLAAELGGGGQSVLATTDLAAVPGASDAAVTRLRVAGGAILQEALAA